MVLLTPSGAVRRHSVDRIEARGLAGSWKPMRAFGPAYGPDDTARGSFSTLDVEIFRKGPLGPRWMRAIPGWRAPVTAFLSCIVFSSEGESCTYVDCRSSARWGLAGWRHPASSIVPLLPCYPSLFHVKRRRYPIPSCTPALTCVCLCRVALAVGCLKPGLLCCAGKEIR